MKEKKISTAGFRNNLYEHINRIIKDKDVYILTSRGKPKVAVINLDMYTTLTRRNRNFLASLFDTFKR